MKTILVVDDEFDMAGTLRAILEAEGYRVDCCADGREVLEHLKTSRPDLIVMDVMMPVLSGFEVLEEMRQTPGLGTVPVVLMSSIVPGVSRQSYPCQAFLNKPFSLDALVKTVKHVIGTGDPAANPH